MKSVSGFSAPYTDPGSGIVLSSTWIQIRQINYSPNSYCFVVSDVYVDQNSVSDMKPIFQNIVSPVQFGSVAWNTYFDPSVMDQPNSDILAQAVSYLQTLFHN